MTKRLRNFCHLQYFTKSCTEIKETLFRISWYSCTIDMNSFYFELDSSIRFKTNFVFLFSFQDFLFWVIIYWFENCGVGHFIRVSAETGISTIRDLGCLWEILWRRRGGKFQEKSGVLDRYHRLKEHSAHTQPSSLEHARYCDIAI